MKNALSTVWCLLLTLGILFSAGCGKSDTAGKANEPGTSSGRVIDAPSDYLGHIVKARKDADKTAAKVDTSVINQAISMFLADNGRNPKDLNELVPKYINRLPTLGGDQEFDYDPATGVVKVRTKTAAK